MQAADANAVSEALHLCKTRPPLRDVTFRNDPADEPHGTFQQDTGGFARARIEYDLAAGWDGGVGGHASKRQSFGIDPRIVSVNVGQKHGSVRCDCIEHGPVGVDTVRQRVIPIASRQPLSCRQSLVRRSDFFEPVGLIDDIGQIHSGDARRITAHVRVAIDEARCHRAPIDTDNTGLWSGQSQDLGRLAHRHETTIADGHRRGAWLRRVGGMDIGIHDDEIGCGVVGLRRRQCQKGR